MKRLASTTREGGRADGIGLPRDLSGEITTELIRARIRVARSASRVADLENLLEIVWRLERELRRPVTLFDLVTEADPSEQARRVRLVRALRLPDQCGDQRGGDGIEPSDRIEPT